MSRERVGGSDELGAGAPDHIFDDGAAAAPDPAYPTTVMAFPVVPDECCEVFAQMHHTYRTWGGFLVTENDFAGAEEDAAQVAVEAGSSAAAERVQNHSQCFRAMAEAAAAGADVPGYCLWSAMDDSVAGDQPDIHRHSDNRDRHDHAKKRGTDRKSVTGADGLREDLFEQQKRDH